MAVRNDLSFTTSTSPRTIIVDEGGAKDTELTIQDLVDTIRDFEDDPLNMSYDKLLNASGKEPLGGGVLVGITATLQNTQVGFEGRLGPDFTQCSITGGNLVALGAGDTEISAIYTTPYTQVILTSSSSATLQEMDAIQYASYQNAIWVDVINGDSGVIYPIGTREFPVNNISNAVTIAQEKGFNTLQVIGDLTLGAGDSVENMEIIGQNIIHSHLTILDAANTLNCEIHECTVEGVLDGGTVMQLCNLKDLTYINGAVYECVISGTITLGGDTTAYFLDCYAGLPGVVASIIDCGDSGQDLSVKNYNGSLKIMNKHGTDHASIGMNSGMLVIDSTVNNGTIIVRGIGQIEDNSTGNAVIDSCGLIEGSQVHGIYEHVKIKEAEVGDTTTANTTKFISTLVETIDSFWTRAALLFTSGDNKGLIRGIKNYTGLTKEVHLQTPLSYMPTNGDKFSIIPIRKFLTPDIEEVSAGVWDTLLVDHVINGSFGKALNLLWDEVGGNREIVNNREYFYKENGDTAMAFVLLDETGDSTMTNVYKRQRFFPV